jgi:hypothetical protein
VVGCPKCLERIRVPGGLVVAPAAKLATAAPEIPLVTLARPAVGRPVVLTARWTGRRRLFIGALTLLAVLASGYAGMMLGGARSPDGPRAAPTQIVPTVKATVKEEAKPVELVRKVEKPAPEESKPRFYEMGQTFQVGYMSYCVNSASLAHSLGKGIMTAKPDGIFLVVDVSVRNDDKQARMVPPFKVLDVNEKCVHDASSKAWMLDDAIGVLKELNPGVSKTGKVVFDIPRRAGDCVLALSGGYWSNDVAYVPLGRAN